MNFNKCSRCGCFFMTDSSVCPNCQPKDQYEMGQLKNFLEENTNLINLDSLSASTGITVKNLNRFLAQEQFADFSNQIQGNSENIGIQL